MDDKQKLENISKGYSEYVSSSIDKAEIYLKEEGVEYNLDSLSKIRAKMAEIKLEDGKGKSTLIRKLWTKFNDETQGKSIDNIIELYPSMPQIACRGLEQTNVSEGEVNDLLLDSSFIEFLERNFDGNSK